MHSVKHIADDIVRLQLGPGWLGWIPYINTIKGGMVLTLTRGMLSSQ